MDELLDALERDAEDFEAQTERLLALAVRVGLVRFCCDLHAAQSDLYVHAIERRN